MRRVPQQHPNSQVTRERDGRASTRQSILLTCCVLLAAGFVFAARQQIAAVQYGYKSEELRLRRELLLEEQRRLLLEIEESSSPANLERRARALGLQPARASQIGADAANPEASADAPGAAPSGVEEVKNTRRGPGAARAASPAFAGSATASLARR